MNIVKARSTHRVAWLALALAAAYPDVTAAQQHPLVPANRMEIDFGTAVVAGDFNGDGRDELVVGEPNANVGNAALAGQIRYYDQLPGLRAFHTINLSTAGIPGTPNGFDFFGFALAVGDFDSDGYDDLVVGAPYRLASDDVGSVWVIYGNNEGLQDFDRVTNHNPPAPEAHSFGEEGVGMYGFGFSLAVGDFGGDGADDLAIGMPGRVVNGQQFAGAVFIRYGADGVGTSSNNAQIWHQNSAGMPGDAAFDNLFGYALAAGQLGRTTNKDDLAIGIPGHDVANAWGAGAVMVMFGTNSVLGTANVQHVHQNWGSTHGTAEQQDAFGTALAAGDFDDDSYDDLVIGVPDEDVDGLDRAGFVNVMYGSSTGVSSTRQFSLAQNGSEGEGLGLLAYFGYALTIGDFDDNGVDDLAIGAPYDRFDYEGRGRWGSASVFFGFSGGLSNSDYQYWNASSFSTFEGWVGGEALCAGDFDEDGVDDLATVDITIDNNVMGIEGRSGSGLTTSGGFRVTP